MSGSDTPRGPARRLTLMAPHGGCSGKVAPAELESLLATAFAGLPEGSAPVSGRMVCGLATGDDAVVVEVSDDRAVVVTTDFFPPVLDDPYDWGRVAAANALSDLYATGAEPLVALNLLIWPTDELGEELAAQVLRGGAAILAEAHCFGGGGHSIRGDTPTYGLAVTGLAHPERLLRNDRARAGQPITLTKPLGLGILNNRHRQTGERFPEAIDTMTRLNAEASRAALAAGLEAATDVTGFGLLGHLHKMARASGVTAVIDADAVPYLEQARSSLADGYLPGGSRRNLDWVRPALRSTRSEDELLLLADAQTSGGLLLAGEIPNSPVVGEFIPAQGPTVIVR